MKNLINIECDYSFEMLYKAAFGKNISILEKSKLQKLNQKEINLLVKKWAKRAGWGTEKRIGEKNTIYIAFFPNG